MKNMLSRFERWWCRDAPPHVLAIFRVVFGSFLLLYWGLKFPYIPMLFSRAGVVLPLYDAGLLGRLLVPPPVGVAWALFMLLILALACLTLGLCTRASALIAALLSIYYGFLSLHLFGTSFDRLFIFFLIVLSCSGADRAFSFAVWRRHGSVFAWEPTSVLPQRILAMQISATYLGVGWQKLWLPDWQSGEVLARGFVGRWGTPLAYWLARQDLPLWMYDMVVAAVKGFELILPFGVWIRRIRVWVFGGLTLFFLSIAVLLSIWWFLILIPACILFFEPEEVHVWLQKMLREHNFRDPH